MHDPNSSLSTSAFATAVHWTGDATVAQRIAAGLTAAVIIGLTWTVIRRTIRGLKARFADDDAMDPFTAAITAMAAALSVNGMWTVFGALHLVTPARVVSCGVLEAAGFAFMRQARRDILAGRPATKNLIVVWSIAILAGFLSACASTTILEAGVRLFFPSLAVELSHSWMLPIEAEVTLTQRQKGRRTWRFLKAKRRVERARTPIGRNIASYRFAMETDRLLKRSLMTGDASDILSDAEKIAKAELRDALGVDPSAPEAHPERVQKRAPKTPARHAARWSESALRDAALDVDAQAKELTGAPASARMIARELRLGHARARELRAWIDARPSTPKNVTVANGSSHH